MDAEVARRGLLTQHEQIRSELMACVELARRLVHGEPVAPALDAALVQLRQVIAEHNAAETELIAGLLHGSPRWGDVLVDRMLEAHLAEHVACRDRLAGSADEIAARIEDVADEIDAHMAAEERTFLNPLVLRDDVITRHRQDGST